MALSERSPEAVIQIGLFKLGEVGAIPLLLLKVSSLSVLLCVMLCVSLVLCFTLDGGDAGSQDASDATGRWGLRGFGVR